jgi:hypothetical protein
LREEPERGGGVVHRISRELLRSGYFKPPQIITPTTGRPSKLNSEKQDRYLVALVNSAYGL